MIRETSPETNDDATATAVITAGDYLNKLAGESIERLCREKLDSGVKRLVVDFSETEIINSIGVSILLDVIDSAKSTTPRSYSRSFARIRVSYLTCLG